MVNKIKNREDKEMIKPNIINGLDLTFSSCLSLFLEEKFPSFFFINKIGKRFIHDKFEIKLIKLKF